MEESAQIIDLSGTKLRSLVVPAQQPHQVATKIPTPGQASAVVQDDQKVSMRLGTNLVRRKPQFSAALILDLRD